MVEVRRRLYLLSFVDEFGPLYALFTLWFNDNGISTPQLSVIFVLWASLGVVLEVPSGALADRVDRRALLAVAFGLRAMGIAVWLIWPSLSGLIVGAVLWAVHDAAASGAWEAMIHDQLEAVGAEERYGVVMARVSQLSNVGLAAGTIAATGLVRAGASIETIGWVNVAIHGASIALVLGLPNVRWVAASEEHPQGWSIASWWATLRDGVRVARSEPRLSRLIVVGTLLGGLFVVDEYIPVLARARGASDALVPVIVLVVWAGLVLGGEVAARRPTIRSSTLTTMLIGGSAAMAVAIALDSLWALVAVGVGYAAVETAWVVTDARFQAAAPKAMRATVTSVRSVGIGLVEALAFIAIAAFSDGNDPTPGLHWVIGIIALTGLLVWRWVPPPLSPQRTNGR